MLSPAPVSMSAHFPASLSRKALTRDVQVAAGRADKPRGVGPIYPKNHVE
jgi:hypothetical protein